MSVQCCILRLAADVLGGGLDKHQDRYLLKGGGISGWHQGLFLLATLACPGRF